MSGLRIDGLAEVLGNIEDAASLIAEGGKLGIETVAERARDLAAAAAPEKTGWLRESLRGGNVHQLAPGGIRLGTTRQGIYADIGTFAFYARFLERGTKFMDKRPFIRPAVAQIRRELKATVSSSIRLKLGRGFRPRKRR